jgi:hypothetical protein
VNPLSDLNLPLNQAGFSARFAALSRYGAASLERREKTGHTTASQQRSCFALSSVAFHPLHQSRHLLIRPARSHIVLHAVASFLR